MPTARPTVIVQARTASQRLPGKVLADLCGAPVLCWLVERLQRSQHADGIVVATTSDPGDDPVEALCEDLGAACFRGHPTDVLARLTEAARWVGAEAIVRVSGDSPLIDAAPVDAVIEAYADPGTDVAENHRTPGWPVGTAAEVLSREALERIEAEARDPRHREHVTLFAYESECDLRIRHVEPPAALRAPEMRLCVDTAADLERARRICTRFGARRDFSLAELVATARREPGLVA